jgi:hypothetical protein
MGKRLAGIKAATGQGKVSTTTPRATDLPAPMAAPPTRVRGLAPEERERVQAAVVDYMADVFELEDAETEDTPHSLHGDATEKVRADVVAYFEDDAVDEN